MALIVGQGGTITLNGQYRDGLGSFVDPSNPLVAIADPNGVTTASGLVPVRDGVGLYHVTYTVPSFGAIGFWTGTWTGSINGVGVSGAEQFQVAAAGSLHFGTSTTIAQPSDIAIYTGKTLSNADQQFCTAMIGYLTAELELYLKRPLSIQTFAETQVMDEGQTAIYFYNSPVVSVASVSVVSSAGPTLLDPKTYQVWPWGIVLQDPTYSLVFSSTSNLQTSVGGLPVQVTYTAGLDMSANLPGRGAIKATIVRACAREYLANASDVQNVQNLHAGRLLDYQFADGNVGGFTDRELHRLKRFRRRVAV